MAETDVNPITLGFVKCLNRFGHFLKMSKLLVRFVFPHLCITYHGKATL